MEMTSGRTSTMFLKSFATHQWWITNPEELWNGRKGTHLMTNTPKTDVLHLTITLMTPSSDIVPYFFSLQGKSLDSTLQIRLWCSQCLKVGFYSRLCRLCSIMCQFYLMQLRTLSLNVLLHEANASAANRRKRLVDFIFAAGKLNSSMQVEIPVPKFKCCWTAMLTLGHSSTLTGWKACSSPRHHVFSMLINPHLTKERTH